MKLKKILAAVSALCMLCAVIPVLPIQETAVISVSAEDTEEYTEGTYENLKYKKYADYVEISGVTDDSITEAVIPAEIDGLPVTSIGFYSFFSKGSLKSVILSDNITSIGGGAFGSCSALTSIVIPDSVVKIGGAAFCYCSDLTFVTIPESVIDIGADAFYETKWLQEKQLENPLVIINHILIDGRACQGDVTVPESVTSITASAFHHCYDLTSVIIKNPDCEIYDSQYTISNTATIYGYEGSTAQAYAEKYNRNFEALGSAPETTETPDLKPGDADGSGKVDILDVITINRAILGKEKLTDEQLKAVDFNGNGKPDAEDSLILMKYIVGLLETLPTP